MNSRKTEIVFVMNNLHCGGAEKALISLLQTMDYSKYNVDLLLFKKEGIFLNQIPKEVTLLDEPREYGYFDMSIKKALFQNFLKGNFKTIYNRICAGFILKNEKNRVVAEQKIWRYLGSSLKPLSKKYDVSVGYLEKTPNYFCVDKVQAKMKIGFIHNDYNFLQMDASIDLPYFEKLDTILTVSEECKTVLETVFPSIASKFSVMYNIISTKTIQDLAQEKINFEKKGMTLMSVGRLNTQKGYDLALAACKILVEKGVDFQWYILGEGELRSEIEKKILKYNLQNHLILLGVKDNPYAYLCQADIFVHTARFEGFGIVIAEAKILGLPMVITDFNIARSHIEHDKNGLIAAMTPEAIAENLLILIQNKTKREQFSASLANEKVGTESEILKFYEIIME